MTHLPIDEPDLRAVATLVSADLGRPWRATSASSLAGGIQPACLATDDRGAAVFVKKGSDPIAPERFAAEADGLAALAGPGVIRTPRVVGVASAPGGGALLVLEAIRAVEPTPAMWRTLGEQLAALHRTRADAFGYPRDNFLGTQPQPNGPLADWPTFLAERRLRPTLRRCVGSGRLGADDARAVERLIDRLPSLVGPYEPPALVHGDLWIGNVLFDAAGPVLIDPAVYHGHREVELAFAELFAGFGPGFFDAYRAAYPIDAGYAERRALWQVHPLLVHVAHYGAEYLGRLREAVGRYA